MGKIFAFIIASVAKLVKTFSGGANIFTLSLLTESAFCDIKCVLYEKKGADVVKTLKSMLSSVTIAAGLYSLLFIAAIPLLCVSAGRNLVLMIISIVILGVGLPGLPLLWLQFGKLVPLTRITAAIENDKIYEVDAIAARLRISRKKVSRRIRRILRRGILRGYYFDGNLVHPIYSCDKPAAGNEV